MGKVKMYVEAFGGSFVDAYCALVDMGDVNESDALLAKCAKLDGGNG